MKVLHVISGLGIGGAENMLVRLAGDPSTQIEHVVVSLTDFGPVGRRLESLGISVEALHLRRVRDLPRAVHTLRQQLEIVRPDVMQTWLYHADLLGGIAAWRSGIPVLWNLRHSDLSPARNKRSTLLVMRVCALLSRRVPDRIISCSETSVSVHVRAGYDTSRMTVIPNGFDTGEFRPDSDRRREVRRELGVDDESVIAGFVGRFHPQKDPRTLIQAAGKVLKDHPEARLLLIGAGFTTHNTELTGWIRDFGIDGQVYLLGLRTDIPRLDAALDVFISSSAGEGLPNAVGEAMACGVPCIVTDVGDSAKLVGDTGYVVPAGDPDLLASAWSRLLGMDPPTRTTLGQRARHRIERYFSLPSIRREYERLWKNVSSDNDRPS